MSDNKNIRGPQDSKRINVNENYEVQYWTKALNVTKDQLVAAVKKVGVMADDVRKFLSSGTLRKS